MESRIRCRRSVRGVVAALVPIPVALCLAGCVPPSPPPRARPKAEAGKGPIASVAPAGAALSHAAKRERAERGKKLFLAECAGCHGERGRGDGPAADQLTPRPRNFEKESFRFRTTPTGEPPRRQDIFDTITRGLPGSGMPAYTFLTEDERWALVDRVCTIAGDVDAPDPEPVVLGPETKNDAESVARGREVYQKMQCAKCHGPEGRGDGPSSHDLKDEMERKIPVRDLAEGVYRGGDGPAALNMRWQTGLNGTPMPSFAASLTNEQGWDLSHYVISLKQPKGPPPADPVARGRAVVEERRCYACHQIEGRGGKVAPSLDISAQKLRPEWVRAFLKGPRPYGKLYPYIPYRMPDLGLSSDEIEGVVALLGKIAGRTGEGPAAAVPTFDAAKLGQGTLLYFLKCTECHNLGTVIPTPEAKRQGPDLINVSKRMYFEWMPKWIENPQQVYPGSAMVKGNLTPEEVEAVRAFVWKTSLDAQAKTTP